MSEFNFPEISTHLYQVSETLALLKILKELPVENPEQSLLTSISQNEERGPEDSKPEEDGAEKTRDLIEEKSYDNSNGGSDLTSLGGIIRRKSAGRSKTILSNR
ncbi:hypothetical protein MAR_013460 [Mya arenaria]|uniref:Uncharacterized protein n=1 Tax=Mya arenaria TaxID=6604 RepID=A0ABY7G3Y5_MYAAR|nr:hypothetical protein MAR_013460 [Mya arenaria]